MPYYLCPFAGNGEGSAPTQASAAGAAWVSLSFTADIPAAPAMLKGTLHEYQMTVRPPSLRRQLDWLITIA